MAYSYCDNENSSNIASLVVENSLILEGKLEHDYCLSVPSSIFTNDLSATTLSRISFNYQGENGFSACLK